MKAIIKSDIKELNIEIELDDLQPKYLYDKFDELFSQKRYKGHDLLLRIRDKENKKQYVWSTQLSPNRTYFLGYCYFLDIDIIEWPMKDAATLIIEE